MRVTFTVTGYNFHTSATSGYTASVDDAGQPVRGNVGFGWYPIGGSFSLGPVSSPNVGVWLWRPVTDDLTPPVITPTVAGTAGSNGWHVSDVGVSWTVTDPDSAVTSTSGCESSSVTSDTDGHDVHVHGDVRRRHGAPRSVVVKRDTVAPTVTCASPPQTFEIYQLGAWVRAELTDATSGPAAPYAQGTVMANTNVAGTFSQVVSGADRAGLRTSRSCAYVVASRPASGRRRRSSAPRSTTSSTARQAVT